MHTSAAGTATSASASGFRFFFGLMLSSSVALTAFAGLAMASGAAMASRFAVFTFLGFFATSVMLLQQGNALQR